MRAYSVNDRSWQAHGEGAIGKVVWAERKTQAASVFLGSYNYRHEFFEGEYPLDVEDVTDRVAEFPPQSEGPHVERRIAVERAAGFRYEGDRGCDTCGLYECDGEVPVCMDCGQCGDCGCVCPDN